MSRILVIGGSSLLGKALKERCPLKHEIKLTWNANKEGCDWQVDVTDQTAVNRIFDRFKPEIVIHCAGITSVDFAEKNRSAANVINVYGIENLLKVSGQYKAYFINISSNAIFDGHNPPYTEESTPNPLNYYGETKLEADMKVWSYPYDFLNLRPILLYGWPWKNGRGNWVTTFLDKVRKGEEVKAVTDVYFQPIYAIDFANIIYRMIELKPTSGDYHIASKEKLNLYQFLTKVAEAFDVQYYTLTMSSIHDFKTLAVRPLDTSFDTSKLNALGIECLSVEEGLALMRRDFTG